MCDNVFHLTALSNQMEGKDRVAYWQNRYVTKDDKWHSDQRNVHLVRHWDVLRVRLRLAVLKESEVTNFCLLTFFPEWAGDGQDLFPAVREMCGPGVAVQ